MKTLRRLLYRDIAAATAFVTLAFVALFFFFDVVEELRWAGRSGSDPGGHAMQALALVALRVPRHVYELLPITLLIGSVYALARLAQSSQFTIMRTSGMGPWQALRSLLILGLVCALLTFVVGDWLAARAEHWEQSLRAARDGDPAGVGSWLKERQGEHSIAVHVRTIHAPGQFSGVRIFDFDAQGRIAMLLHADTAQAQAGEAAWLLHGVQRYRVMTNGAPGASADDDGHGAVHQLLPERLDTLRWPSDISAEMVAAAQLRPERMSTPALFAYVRHLQANGQLAQKYEIEFWRKVFYPLSCLVMLVLALPFAYLHFRQQGIAAYVFGGVLAGISFFLLNTVFSYIGTLHAWPPALAAVAPSLLYSLLPLAIFAWPRTKPW